MIYYLKKGRGTMETRRRVVALEIELLGYEYGAPKFRETREKILDMDAAS